MKIGGENMNTLSKELIEDFKSDVQISDLCRKYGISRKVIRNQLIEMGLKKENQWGGCRKGCGRKKAKKGEELQKIREQNMKIGYKHKQPEGSKVKRSSLYSAIRTGYYTGGWE